MSMPNIPDINPSIELDIEDSSKLLFNSLALLEMGLSHIVNAEGEKLQYILKKQNNLIEEALLLCFMTEEKFRKLGFIALADSYKKLEHSVIYHKK